ncbi:MAG TPA: non-homologous end-joining DNA ligase, partial [Acidimicrobiia bacterium]
RPPPEKKPDPDPMLATSAQEPFDDPEWAFEPKWDGIRAIADCNPTARLISRNRRDITAGYPELSRLHERLVALDAMIDGEIVAFDESGPSFQKLQRRMHLRDPVQIERLMKTIPVVFMAFDILYLDGHDLTSLSYSQRRERLETALVLSDEVQLSPSTLGDGIALFRAIAERGMEGVVAKRLDSGYEPGTRSRAWLKLKTSFDADVVIVGWTLGSGRREGTVGSMVMAMYDQGTLRYVGQVGTGFDQSSLEEARQLLIGLGEAPPPFDREVLRGAPELRKARWVPPVLVAAVEHRQVTSAGRLRAPSFKGFREDKRPEECTVDQLV